MPPIARRRPRPLRPLAAAVTSVAALCACGVLAAGSAAAGPTTCAGNESLPPGTYSALVVPAGERCFVDGDTSILGNVKVEPGGYLAIGSTPPNPTHVTIGGNVLVLGDAQWDFYGFCGFICFQPSSLHVGGNIVATRSHELSAGGADGDLRVDGNVVISDVEQITFSHADIGGNILVTGVTGTETLVGFNTVAGNVAILHNLLQVGPGFGYDIVEGNVVQGNLICLGNDPAPINQGLPNTARTELGQCAGL